MNCSTPGCENLLITTTERYAKQCMWCITHNIARANDNPDFDFS